MATAAAITGTALPPDTAEDSYNLASDPGETRNLYLDHPDRVNHLSALLRRYQQQGYSRPLGETNP